MAESMSSAAKLNQLIMDRIKAHPEYEVTAVNTGTHRNKFNTVVRSRIISNGPVLKAEGTGASKKESRSDAASNFMKMHLRDRIELPNFLSRSSSTCSINVKEINQFIVLQNFCAKMKLPQPQFRELDATGPPHARQFKTECIVANLKTEGEGTTKSEAKMNAATKMLQLVMQEKEVIEVFESPVSTMATQPLDVICLNDNLRVSQCPTPMGIFARRSSTSSISSVASSAFFESELSPLSEISLLSIPLSRATPDTKIVFGVMNHPATVDKSKSYEDSTTSLIDLSDDFGSTLEISKVKSKSSTDLADRSEDEQPKVPSSNNFARNLAVLEVADQIDATLNSVEKQLYDEIRGKLGDANSPREKSVIILHHDFDVYIDNAPKPKICEGSIVCNDVSIRIAVLAKLLMELKQHAIVTVTKKGTNNGVFYYLDELGPDTVWIMENFDNRNWGNGADLFKEYFTCTYLHNEVEELERSSSCRPAVDATMYTDPVSPSIALHPLAITQRISSVDARVGVTMYELSVPKLHNIIMAKVGIEPMYEVVFRERRPDKEIYMMRVTCQMSPNEKPLSALGHYGRSMEIAKEKAAIAFMEKFIDTRPNRMNFSCHKSTCRMLQNHCVKNDLGEPQYTVLQDGGFHQPCIVKCQISQFTTEGRGAQLCDAVITAAIRMMKILNDNETGPSDKNPAPEHNSVDDGNCVSTPAETPKVQRNPETTRMLLKMLNDHRKPKKVRENGNDLEARPEFMDC